MNPMIFIGTITIAVIITVGLFNKAKLSLFKGAAVGIGIGILSGVLVYAFTTYVASGLDKITIALLDLIAVLLVGMSLFTVWFFRDPERTPPQKEGIIVAPADGKIKYIKEINAGEVPVSIKGDRKATLTEFAKTDILENEGWLVGIVMSIIDVHKNRAPLSGKITLAKYTPGKFVSLKSAEGLTNNERNTIIIEGEKIKIGVVQIASRLVRRIVSYVKEGDTVKIGGRIGMIKFSSQTDLIIPKHCRVLVKEGEQVYGGVTVIAEFEI
jgi:phosphatidylserine decarboxylase